MKNEDAIEALNKLITFNNDRIKGYGTASEITEELDLKTLFSQFILTSQKCNKELILEVKTLGGIASNGKEATGKFFRLWIDVKATLESKDRKAILNSCDYGEDSAKESYDYAIKNGFKHLSVKQRIMIFSQKSSLKIDHDRVKTLQSAIAKV